MTQAVWWDDEHSIRMQCLWCTRRVFIMLRCLLLSFVSSRFASRPLYFVSSFRGSCYVYVLFKCLCCVTRVIRFAMIFAQTYARQCYCSRPQSTCFFTFIYSCSACSHVNVNGILISSCTCSNVFTSRGLVWNDDSRWATHDVHHVTWRITMTTTCITVHDRCNVRHLLLLRLFLFKIDVRVLLWPRLWWFYC